MIKYCCIYEHTLKFIVANQFKQVIVYNQTAYVRLSSRVSSKVRCGVILKYAKWRCLGKLSSEGWR